MLYCNETSIDTTYQALLETDYPARWTCTKSLILEAGEGPQEFICCNLKAGSALNLESVAQGFVPFGLENLQWQRFHSLFGQLGPVLNYFCGEFSVILISTWNFCCFNLCLLILALPLCTSAKSSAGFSVASLRYHQAAAGSSSLLQVKQAQFLQPLLLGHLPHLSVPLLGSLKFIFTSFLY